MSDSENLADGLATSDVQRRVAYISSLECIQKCDCLPKVKGRARRVHSLIEAYGLLQHMSVVAPPAASDNELRLFHSTEYLKCLRHLSQLDDGEKSIDNMEEFGLAFDCPVFEDLYDCVRLVAGGSLAAANCIISGAADIAINWCGGWHHAKRDEASGFCYINDIVLCILRLRERFGRVLYVDLDLHHGDGVEDAFCATGKVLTVSFHKHSPGFFPGSGDVTDVGVGKGKYYAVNIPLKDGIDDHTYMSVFTRVVSAVQEKFCPEVIVCQCGADGVAGDPLSCFNLTPQVLSDCIQYLMDFHLPLVLLGGGGYSIANTSRCWTLLTATALNVKLPTDIPDHEYFPEYGPSFELDVIPSYVRNLNTEAYTEGIVCTVLSNLEYLCASS